MLDTNSIHCMDKRFGIRKRSRTMRQIDKESECVHGFRHGSGLLHGYLVYYIAFDRTTTDKGFDVQESRHSALYCIPATSIHRTAQ